MYERIIAILAASNIGSFIKEDIIQNDLIRKDGDDFYYKRIEAILISDKSSRWKEAELTSFLMRNLEPIRDRSSYIDYEENLYSVKDVCRKYRITRKALFYYDRIGLLKPTERKGKQLFKYYNDESLERLESILMFRDVGLTISEVKEIIDEKDNNKVLIVLKKAKERIRVECEVKQEQLRRLNNLIELFS